MRGSTISRRSALLLGAILLTVLAPLAAQQRPAVNRIVTDHLQIETSVSASAVAPGSAFWLVVDIKPRPRMHVYAPGAKGYKIISLTLNPNPLIVVKPLQYPPSQLFLFEPLSERVPVFQEPFTLKQPLAVGATRAQRAQLAKTSTLTISGTLNYQACDDKLCFLPKSVPLTYSVAVKGPAR